jgi:hypothetical protein
MPGRLSIRAFGVGVLAPYKTQMEAMSCARSFCISTKYGSCTDVIHAFSTSEDMNSRIVMTVCELLGGAKSCRIDRMTRVIMLQHRVSRIRSAWVQKSITGSNISVEESTKCLIESDSAGGGRGTLGSAGSSSGSIDSGISLVDKLIVLGLCLAPPRCGSRRLATIITVEYVSCRRMLSDFISSAKSPSPSPALRCSMISHSEVTFRSILINRVDNIGGKNWLRKRTGQSSIRHLEMLRRTEN